MTPTEALRFLHETVKPSLGCTEPACAALTAAAAAECIRGDIDSIAMIVNPGLYKNGMSVAIPGFDRVGMDYATALGAYIGTRKSELQIFQDITPTNAAAATTLVESGHVSVTVDPSQTGIYAKCTITGRNDNGETDIAEGITAGGHTNLVSVRLNGESVFEANRAGNSANQATNDLLDMTIAEISQLADSLNAEDIDWLVDETVANDEVAAFGVKHPSTVGIGAALEQNFQAGEVDEMMRLVGTAIESRLDGCPLSVTSSAGAGSKGLALTIPLSVAVKHMTVKREQYARALAFGHLTNSYINGVIGKLSAMCTCAVAASTAASAALVKLWGGSDEQIGFAIRNMTGAVSGMICDGGKTGCAMKLAMATSAAYLSAKMAIGNSSLRASDGICDESPEQCIANIARIASHGMYAVDSEILGIMLDK